MVIATRQNLVYMYNLGMPTPVGDIQYLIYGLIDPKYRVVRYVGKSATGMRRPKRHLVKRSDDLTHCANWVRQVQRDGRQIEIVILEVSSPETIVADEQWWIFYGRLSDWKLTNHTDGGEGTVGFKHKEGTKEQLSELAIRRFQNSEAYDRHLEAHRTPEYRALASLIAKRARQLNPGLMVTGETNIAKRPDIRAKISKAAKARGPRSPETKKKISEAFYTRARTPKELLYWNRYKNKSFSCGTLPAYRLAKRKASLGEAGCGPCTLCKEACNAYARATYAKRKIR
jgi:hypothetical protein